MFGGTDMYGPFGMENRVKKTLAGGGFAFGCSVAFVRNPAIMRLIAAAGYEFVLVAFPHSSFSIESVGDMCEMARASGLVPVVVVHTRDGELCKRLRDIGAMGLFIGGNQGDISSRSQVDDLLKWILYPPQGIRDTWTHGGVMVDYRFPLDPKDEEKRRKFINDNTLVVVQVQSREGVERIDEILEGGGIDVIEIGRTDLSVSLGVPRQRQHPLVLKAIDQVVEACRNRNVTVGAVVDTREDGEDLVGRGLRLLMKVNDLKVLSEAYSDGLSMLRSLANV
jgi:2-keto-3-deoxy-L-rhamnonate aldolase RhmA